jgi:hypothetical protein
LQARQWVTSGGHSNCLPLTSKSSAQEHNAKRNNAPAGTRQVDSHARCEPWRGRLVDFQLRTPIVPDRSGGGRYQFFPGESRQADLSGRSTIAPAAEFSGPHGGAGTMPHRQKESVRCSILMKSYGYGGPAFTEPRSHPWADTPGSPPARYYDLTTTPALIRSALEDFVPWSHYPAIDVFYSLLEWLNRPGAALESNDCAFSAPELQGHPERADALQCQGRVMVLFRALEHNRDGHIAGLENRLHQSLAPLDPTFDGGAIGTTLVPVRYRALPAGEQLGDELMISFWAWGNSEQECLKNLARLLRGLSSALEQASASLQPES